uniref:Aquaporin n=1 Tax=Steinernema glaseri TaxID=37863 RepID=A0A1I8A3B6_9BILA
MTTNILNRLKAKVGIRDDLARCALCECVCTAFYMYVGFCSNANYVISRQPEHQYFAGQFAWGMGQLFSVQMGFAISAVSFFQYTFGRIGLRRMLFYWVAQFFGAFCGAALTFLTYYDGINDFDGGHRQVYGPNATAGIFATYPRGYLSVTGAIIDQIACTAVMCICISLITDRNNQIPRFLQPLFHGLMICIIGMAVANAGNGMNPARDLAPRLFTYIAGYGIEVFSYRNYTWFWIPIVFPMPNVANMWIQYVKDTQLVTL